MSIIGFVGVMAMVTSVEALTIMGVEPQTDPAQACRVTDPTDTAKALPWFVASPVTEAIVLSEELQVTEARVWVVVSLKVPVAVKRCGEAMETDGLKGVIAIDARLGGVSVPGWYSSALASALPELSSPPAMRTVPSLSRVAVPESRATVALLDIAKVPLPGS